LSADADIVLIDAPAMLAVGDTAAMAPRVDAIVYVVSPERLRRPMLESVREQLAQLPCRKLGLIAMTASGDHHAYGYYAHHGAAQT
jgi:Mrp family chromosome partitioning ATPase